MSRSCAVSSCKYKTSALCHCCNMNICVDHLKEHNDLNKSQLNSLNNEIIALTDQFTTFNIDQLIREAREKLDKWQDDCHKIINYYYEQKCQELEQYCSQKMDQQQNKINQFQLKIRDLIQNEITTQKNIELLKLTICDIKQEINKFEEKGIPIDIRPFTIDIRSISIKDLKPNAFNIDKSILLSPYRTIECHHNWQSELSTNDRFILISLGKNLCILDRDLTLIKQSPWIYESIYDMCWSSTLSNFILITERKKVYRINEITLLVERVYGIEDKDWLSCTCSDTYLYLTTREVGTTIFQFKLSPLIRLVKRWQSPYSCKSYESIHDIEYNDRTLALIIRETFTGVVDIQLRSSATLNCLWSLPLDLRSSGIWSRINCCLLQYDEWLVVHAATSRLFHISKDGKLKIVHEYHSRLNNATMFSSDTLIIHSGTKVNFHKL